MTRPLIALTGATGHVGGAVAALLAAAGADLRLVVRDPSRAPAGLGQVSRSSYRDRDAAEQALRGADLLFMVSAAESADRLAEHRTFIDAAAAAGVRHVVYTSFQGRHPMRCSRWPATTGPPSSTCVIPGWPGPSCATRSTSTSCPIWPVRTG